MNPIVLAPFLRSLAIQNPAVFDVAPETMAKYRAMADLSGVHYASEQSAKLLVAALLFRPADEAELARMWGQHRNEIAKWVVKGVSSASVEIHQSVLGQNLKQAIFEATLIRIKSDNTLRNYAKELSARSGQKIVFHPSLKYSPELATAFARLAVECRQSRKQSGLETAFKRWGYVPSVEMQIA